MIKQRQVGYIVTTTLVVLAFAGGGLADLVQGPDMVSAMQQLGYPQYLLLILGVWKMLGAVAVALPRFPLLKEWAYAGMTFDLSGAALSHAAVGDPASAVLTPLVLLALVWASWALRPQSRRLTREEVPVRTERKAEAVTA